MREPSPSAATATSAAPRSARLVALLVAPAGVVVALVLLGLRLHFQPPNVPEYALGGGVAGAGDAGGELVLAAGHDSRFEFEATPATEVQGAVTARAFLVRASGMADTARAEGGGESEDVRVWRVPMEIGRDGSVHVGGTVDQLFAGVPRGEWEVAVAVGRPEMLPNDARELLQPMKQGRRTDPDGGAAAWRVVRRRVSLR